MVNTLIAFLFAHILGDFILQTRWIRAHKRNLAVLVLHVLIVGSLAYVSIGFTAKLLVLSIAGSHLLIEVVKTYWPGDSFRGFMTEQIAHFLVIFVAASFFPETYNTGVWQPYGMLDTPPQWLVYIPAGWVEKLPEAMLLIAGFALATRAGQIGIGLFMAPLAPEGEAGIPRAGIVTGNLERGITYLAMLGGFAQIVGLLIVAKAILGFEAASNDKKARDYLTVDLLASFGWAFTVSLGVLALRELIA